MSKEDTLHILEAMKKSYMALGIPDPEAVEALETAINAVKAEPCEDSISRQAAIEAIKEMQLPIMRSDFPSEHFVFKGLSDALCCIEGLPSVNPVKIGHWIHRNDDHDDWLECSECGHGADGEVKYGEGTPFCPMCGAKMEEEE